MTSQDVRQAWRRIRAWYEANVDQSRPDLFDWGPPATDAEIEALQDVIGQVLPDDVRTTYQLHNGTGRNWILPGGYLMPLSEVQESWEMFKDAVDQGLFKDEDRHLRPCALIKQRHWNPRWIPVLHNGGGDFHCIDMDPAEGGTVGQFIKFQHETGPSHLLASSLGDFLVKFSDGLESGAFEFDTVQETARRIAERENR